MPDGKATVRDQAGTASGLDTGRRSESLLSWGLRSSGTASRVKRPSEVAKNAGWRQAASGQPAGRARGLAA